MDKNKLINDNYQNIYKLAQRISKTYGLPFDVFEDLQKEGYISLIEQYESYNENSEASFWTYAYKGVRNKMLSAVQFYFNTVTIPEHLNRQFTAINRIKARNPELTDIQLTNVISEEMKISAEKAEELLVLSAKEKVSIDKLLSDFGSVHSIAEKHSDDFLLSLGKFPITALKYRIIKQIIKSVCELFFSTKLKWFRLIIFLLGRNFLFFRINECLAFFIIPSVRIKMFSFYLFPFIR